MHTQTSEFTSITVADTLELPELRAGDPELIAGQGGLGRHLRWAHVISGAAAFGLLDGGELLLTTGAGWPSGLREQHQLAAAVVNAEPAAVILELGTHLPTAPGPLIEACDTREIPLIILRREVRFVQITQRIHQLVLAAQTEALSARTEIHEMLTELGLNRSPVDYVIERLADTLGAPVVLDDSAEHVVAWAARDRDPETVLAPWAGAGGATLPAGSERVAVEAHGRRWGHLAALPGPPHPAGRRTVLELGALALALGRLADTTGEQWLRLSSKQLFDTLLSGRYRRDTELSAQLSAAGLPIEDRTLLGATLQGTGDFGSHDTLERAVLETALRRAVAPEGRVIVVADEAGREGEVGNGATLDPTIAPAPTGRTRFLALLSFPTDDPRVAQSLSHSAPPLATRLARELDMLIPSTTPASWRAHLALGAAGRGVRALSTSLERVRAAGQLRPAATVGRVRAQQAERQALAYLIRGLAAAPEVQEYAATTLGPLVAHDAKSGAGHSGDLLTVLRAYLDNPTNRSLAAQGARLSRSVFYQRLSLIEELLDVDLSDGTTIATLTVALLARGDG